MTPFRKYILPLPYVLFLAAAFYLMAPANSSGPAKGQLKAEETIEIERVEAADLPDYQRPAYFSIFNFIISFLPGSQR